MEEAAQSGALPLTLPPFTRAGYRRLVQGFLDAGYRPATFEDVGSERRDVILRHDVDVSLEAAVSIAELEYGMAVPSTYFIMVSNSFYNLFSPDGRRMVARLAELRRHIGLHFDFRVYPASSGDALAACAAAIAHEYRVLASIVGSPIEMISLHNPRPEFVNRERPDGVLPHTYEPRFFAGLTYVADSGGCWRFGGPFERPAFKNGTAIHLLTHPIWWDHDEPTAGPHATLRNFAAAHQARTHRSLVEGFKPYREWLETKSPPRPER